MVDKYELIQEEMGLKLPGLGLLLAVSFQMQWYSSRGRPWTLSLSSKKLSGPILRTLQIAVRSQSDGRQPYYFGLPTIAGFCGWASIILSAKNSRMLPNIAWFGGWARHFELCMVVGTHFFHFCLLWLKRG